MRKNAHESSSSSCNPVAVIGHMLPFLKKCSVEHIERSGGGGVNFLGFRSLDVDWTHVALAGRGDAG